MIGTDTGFPIKGMLGFEKFVKSKVFFLLNNNLALLRKNPARPNFIGKKHYAIGNAMNFFQEKFSSYKLEAIKFGFHSFSIFPIRKGMAGV